MNGKTRQLLAESLAESAESLDIASVEAINKIIQQKSRRMGLTVEADGRISFWEVTDLGVWGWIVNLTVEAELRRMGLEEAAEFASSLEG